MRLYLPIHLSFLQRHLACKLYYLLSLNLTMNGYTYQHKASDFFAPPPNTQWVSPYPQQQLPYPFYTQPDYTQWQGPSHDALIYSDLVEDAPAAPPRRARVRPRRGSSYYNLGLSVQPNRIRRPRVRRPSKYSTIPYGEEAQSQRDASSPSLKRKAEGYESEESSKRIRTSYAALAEPMSMPVASSSSSPAKIKRPVERDANGKRIRSKDRKRMQQEAIGAAVKPAVSYGPPQITYPSSIPEPTISNPYPVTSVPFYPPTMPPSYSQSPFTGPSSSSSALEQEDQQWDTPANRYAPEQLYEGTYQGQYRPIEQRLEALPLVKFTGKDMSDEERERMLRFTFDFLQAPSPQLLVSPLDPVAPAVPAASQAWNHQTQVANWTGSAGAASLRCRRMSSVLRQPRRLLRGNSRSLQRRPSRLQDNSRLPARLWA